MAIFNSFLYVYQRVFYDIFLAGDGSFQAARLHFFAHFCTRFSAFAKFWMHASAVRKDDQFHRGSKISKSWTCQAYQALKMIPQLSVVEIIDVLSPLVG